LTLAQALVVFITTRPTSSLGEFDESVPSIKHVLQCENNSSQKIVQLKKPYQYLSLFIVFIGNGFKYAEEIASNIAGVYFKEDEHGLFLFNRD